MPLLVRETHFNSPPRDVEDAESAVASIVVGAQSERRNVVAFIHITLYYESEEKAQSASLKERESERGRL